jgi:hypothetical protein
MAQFVRYVASITTIDGVLRPSVSSFYVLKTDADDYLAAPDEAGRNMTSIGALFSRYMDMTQCAQASVSVGIEVQEDPVPNPADSVYRGNKLQFSVRSGGRGLNFTVPGRDPASFTQNVDALSCAVATPLAMANFISSVESTVVDAFGNPFDVTRVTVVD